jgi:transposase
MNVSHTLIAKALKRAGLKPHRFERYMASDDPAFEQKAADVIGLHVNPPQRAAVFCVDEKTAIQAHFRLDPVLSLSPGRAERHGSEYCRHGTLPLYAGLNTNTGEVRGRTVERHTSEAFVAFLSDVVASQPAGRQIHVVVDNLSDHRSKRVREFLADFPNVHLHFTSTHSSWINQVEIWFAKIAGDVIARGVIQSVRDPSKELLRNIRHFNKTVKPIRRNCIDVSHRIGASVSTETCH